jgi:hypothetical protein
MKKNEKRKGVSNIISKYSIKEQEKLLLNFLLTSLQS